MAPKLKIPGTSGTTSAKIDELAKENISLPFTISVQQVVDVAAAREAGGAVTVELTQPLPEGEQRRTGEVCEVELEGGITLWLRPGSLYRDFGVQRARGAEPAGEKDVWEIAPALPSRGMAARGGTTGLGMRKVTVYHWERAAEPPAAAADVGKPKRRRGAVGTVLGAAGNAAAGMVAGKIAIGVGRAVEQHLLKGNEPGLYRVELRHDFSMTPCKGFVAEGPILLFLHGTRKLALSS